MPARSAEQGFPGQLRLLSGPGFSWALGFTAGGLTGPSFSWWHPFGFPATVSVVFSAPAPLSGGGSGAHRASGLGEVCPNRCGSALGCQRTLFRGPLLFQPERLRLPRRLPRSSLVVIVDGGGIVAPGRLGPLSSLPFLGGGLLEKVDDIPPSLCHVAL